MAYTDSIKSHDRKGNTMGSYTKNERETAARASKQFDRLITPGQIKPLISASRLLRKLFEAECNGCTREKHDRESWKSYDKARAQQMEWVEKRQLVVTNRIQRLCDDLGVSHYIQSDPRGCALYIGTTDPCRYNTEGIAIG